MPPGLPLVHRQGRSLADVVLRKTAVDPGCLPRSRHPRLLFDRCLQNLTTRTALVGPPRNCCHPEASRSLDSAHYPLDTEGSAPVVRAGTE